MSTAATLREQQKSATREAIAQSAFELLSQHGEINHEAVALHARVAARTVYRHFPTQSDLIAATWEKLKEKTDTRFPSRYEEIVELAPIIFANFNKNEAIVRASLASGTGLAVRDRGAAEGRKAFARSLSKVLRNFRAQEQRQIIAVFLALYSAPAWQLMKDRGGLSGNETSHAVRWAMQTLLAAIENENQRRSR